ncbi:archaeal type cofactor-independent phosphoglycerate mutase [Rozella allomycis CSF55]|uniref:Archaeal type cofactor-independent phosphoglycerate mutase n=1 Tax=Rozella allomycis (strain CSF55) TaxID=988480 RepID=A0A075ANF9_ROZAC|nr:Metalloenzyme domain-containing protein [Rozella allomycis CSF55]RKP21296.1 archaeal type cofactor-independent phosphoglycerate mutase [Rozella allomycis CSF55]|eukprot:EPZ31344.1 Metalloenzyme domain-containing protein [Rozella allomycis CSF55]
MPKPKILFILIDGLGDVGIKSKDFQTPLQLASTSHLDLLSKYGLNGMIDPVDVGLACGSDTAHLSLFGYDSRQVYRGRGAFEAMGAGLDLQPGDIAFKSNFAIIDDSSNIVISRRADRNFEHSGPIQINCKYATEHRCGIRIRGEFALSDQITGTDPLKDNRLLLKSEPLSHDDEVAVRTSQIVNKVSDELRELLKQHPENERRNLKGMTQTNVVLLRGAGGLLEIPSFISKTSLKGFMIAPTCIIAGLGKCIGLDVINVQGATGDYKTNLIAKANAAIQIISESYDFGFLHIKSVDDAGHDRNIDLKISWIEKVDQMISRIIDQAKAVECLENLWIIVTGDHSTPVEYGDHSCEPVPFVLCKLRNILKDDKTLADDVQRFNEICSSKGALGRFSGFEIMNSILPIIMNE